MSDKFKFESFEKGHIANLYGNFTGGKETDDLFETLEEIASSDNNKVIVNFQDVAFASSIVIGLFVKTHKLYTDNSGRIIICNLNKTLANVFKITKVADIVDIADDIESAKAMIK